MFQRPAKPLSTPALVIAAIALLVSLCSITNAVARGHHPASGDRQFIIHNGIERSYVVRLPGVLPGDGKKLPLVLVLHGGGGNAENAETMTGFTAKARAEGFIVVYPEGTGRLKDMLLTWNAKHCCGKAMKDDVDDVGFVRDLLDTLVARYPIDTKRIYATGMSNGGMMVHRLGIELSDRFAAIATVVAAVFGDEPSPKHALSALMINGKLDKNVPSAGGPPGGRFSSTWDGTLTKSSTQQAVFWATADHCGTGVETADGNGVTHRKYSCPNGVSVESYLLADNGHAWPGGERGSRLGDTPSTTFEATDVIWSFFRFHSR